MQEIVEKNEADFEFGRKKLESNAKRKTKSDQPPITPPSAPVEVRPSGGGVKIDANFDVKQVFSGKS